jgi:hypothetical protein
MKAQLSLSNAGTIKSVGLMPAAIAVTVSK